jgi:hypothetical protein
LEQLEKSENPELDLSIFEPKEPAQRPKIIHTPTKKKQHEGDHVFCFRILSTWGHDHTVGLTEIELFNQNGEQIHVPENKVIVKGGLGGGANVMKLFDGKKKTTSDAHMWQTTLPTLSYLEIFITLPNNEKLCQIKVWNFNKNVNVSKSFWKITVVGECKRREEYGNYSKRRTGLERNDTPWLREQCIRL